MRKEMTGENFWQEAKKMKEGFVLAMFTDEIWLYEWSDSKIEEAKVRSNFLLEIRVFDKEKELKLFRSNIGEVFKGRERNDIEEDYFDERQYLDIDWKRSRKLYKEKHRVRAIGGGVYYLPVELDMKDESDKNVKIKIHNYVDYLENGQAYVCDWRLVELKEE